LLLENIKPKGKLKHRPSPDKFEIYFSGLQTGANTIQRGLYTVGQGPRQIQGVLQRISQQIEEQRMILLLQEQRDAPVDVQIGFQVYEDAPQELRSRLWMALLQQPELVERFQAILRADQALVEAPEKEKEESNEEHEKEETAAAAAGTNEIEPKAEKNDNESTDALPTIEDNGHLDNNPSTSPSPSPLPATTPNTTTAEEKQKQKDVEKEDWEVVGDRGAQRFRQGRRLLAGSSLHRTEPWSKDKEDYRQHLMASMAAVPWPLPIDVDVESRYSTLLQISIGQEEVDDVIARDIHRTFPEYPLFGLEQGQQALFRVLKAYSLHDLETGYCQGMAFVAGLVLFFVPEEAAFQIFCRLLAETGPNLRRHYLPGLRGLKVELKTFEILLGKFLPNIKKHLEAQGAVPVLYASQWFLSTFSCPFPVGFACRLIDVMLTENSDAVLMRVALAIMAECEAELLMQEDFEELLTYLKVEPVQWSTHRLRRVLNSAIHASPLTAEDLKRAIEEAENEENLLIAPLPVVAAAAAGAAGVVEREGGEGVVSRSKSPLKPRQKSQGSLRRISTTTTTEENLVTDGEDEDKEAAAVEENEEDNGAEDNDVDHLTMLAEHQAELDTAYMQMVLDLDNLWGGDESGSGAVEAYETALASGRSRGGASDVGEAGEKGKALPSPPSS
jgi:Rab-GTPase-TBC domain